MYLKVYGTCVQHGPKLLQKSDQNDVLEGLRDLLGGSRGRLGRVSGRSLGGSGRGCPLICIIFKVTVSSVFLFRFDINLRLQLKI